MIKPTVILAISVFLSGNLSAQLSPLGSDFPNVTNDRVETKPLSADMRMRWTIPGVMGAGAIGTFVKPNLIHVNGEVGIGWTLRTKKLDTERNWVSPWARLRVGYPLHFEGKGSAKLYQSVSTSGNTTTSKFYALDAPVHRYIIPEVGIHFNPVAYRIVTQAGYTGNDAVAPIDKFFYSFQATVLTTGISYKSIIDCDMLVKDSKTGKVTSGRMTKSSGVEAGILFATKSQIEFPRGGATVEKSSGLGYYVTFRVPFYSNSFEFGLNSLGYNDKNNSQKAAQLYFGWTVHL